MITRSFSDHARRDNVEEDECSFYATCIKVKNIHTRHIHSISFNRELTSQDTDKASCIAYQSHNSTTSPSHHCHTRAPRRVRTHSAVWLLRVACGCRLTLPQPDCASATSPISFPPSPIAQTTRQVRFERTPVVRHMLKITTLSS